MFSFLVSLWLMVRGWFCPTLRTGYVPMTATQLRRLASVVRGARPAFKTSLLWEASQLERIGTRRISSVLSVLAIGLVLMFGLVGSGKEVVLMGGMMKTEGIGIITLRGRKRKDILMEIMSEKRDLYIVPMHEEEVTVDISTEVHSTGKFYTEVALATIPSEVIRYTQYKNIFNTRIWFSTDMVGISVDAYKLLLKNNKWRPCFGIHSQTYLDEGNGTVYLCQGTIHCLVLMLAVSKKCKVNLTDMDAVKSASEEDFLWIKPTTTNKLLKYVRGEGGGAIFPNFEDMLQHNSNGAEDQRYSRDTFKQVQGNMGLSIMQRWGIWATQLADGMCVVKEGPVHKLRIQAAGCTSKRKGGVIGTRSGINSWFVKAGDHTYDLPFMNRDVLYTTEDNTKMKTFFRALTVIRHTFACWHGGSISSQVMTTMDKMLALHRLNGNETKAVAAIKAAVNLFTRMNQAGIDKTREGLKDLSKLDKPDDMTDTAAKLLVKQLIRGIKGIGGDIDSLLKLNVVKELKQSSIIGRCNKYTGVGAAHDFSRTGSIRMDQLGLVPKYEAVADMPKGFKEGWYSVYRSPASSEGSFIVIYIRQMSDEMKAMYGGRTDGVLVFGCGVKEQFDAIKAETGKSHMQVLEGFFMQREWARAYGESATWQKEVLDYAKTLQIRLNGCDYDNDPVIMTSLEIATPDELSALKEIFWCGTEFNGKDFESYLFKGEYVVSDAGMLQYFEEMHSGKFGEAGVGKYALIANMTLLFYSQNEEVLKVLFTRYRQYNKRLELLGGHDWVLPSMADSAKEAGVTNDESKEHLNPAFRAFLLKAALVGDIFLQASVDKAFPDPKERFNIYISWLEELLFGRHQVACVSSKGKTITRANLRYGNKSIDGRCIAHHAMVARGTGLLNKDHKAHKGLVNDEDGTLRGVLVWQNYTFDITGGWIEAIKGAPVTHIPAVAAPDWWSTYRGAAMHEAKGTNGVWWDERHVSNDRIGGIADMFFMTSAGKIVGMNSTIASAVYLKAREAICGEGGLMWELKNLSASYEAEARILPVSGKGEFFTRNENEFRSKELTLKIKYMLMILHSAVEFRYHTEEEIAKAKNNGNMELFNEVLDKYPTLAGLVPHSVFLRGIREDEEEGMDEYTVLKRKREHREAWFKAFDAEVEYFNKAGLNGRQIVGQCFIAFLEGAPLRDKTYTWGRSKLMSRVGPEYKFTGVVTSIVLPYISDYLATVEHREEIVVSMHCSAEDADKINGKTMKVRVIRSAKTGKISINEAKAVTADGGVVSLYKRTTADGVENVDIVRLFGVKTMQSRMETVWSASVSADTAMHTKRMLVTLTVFGYVDLDIKAEVDLKEMGFKKVECDKQAAVADLDDKIEKELAAELEVEYEMEAIIIEDKAEKLIVDESQTTTNS